MPKNEWIAFFIVLTTILGGYAIGLGLGLSSGILSGGAIFTGFVALDMIVEQVKHRH